MKRFIIKSFAILFLKYIFCLFELSDGIVSDKDSLFTSKFWSTFYYYLAIKRQLNIIFYI